MKFKVTLIIPTTIRANIFFEADSAVEAEIMAADELKRKIAEHQVALKAYSNQSALSRMDYPNDPVEWDDTDAIVNSDTAQVEVDEVESLEDPE
jgi:hypothetical protein